MSAFSVSSKIGRMTDEELKGLFESLRRENVTMRQESATAGEETRRHFGVAMDRMEKRFDQLAEAIANVDEELDRHVERLDDKMDRGFADTQAMIKFSHAELDRRVAKLEQAFADLQSRVERLETTTH
jgi:prefoldin subunit 5